MKEHSHLFAIEKGFTALNHGSFGACPKVVMEYQFDLIKRMESLTTRFFMMEMKPLIIESLRTLSEFINSPLDDLVFIRNATSAANAVINSLPFQDGDEIVTTNLIYESCANLLKYFTKKKGVVLKTADISFPDDDEDMINDKIFNLVNERTKLIFIDHITSTTAMIMPVEKIIGRAKDLGIETFVDGAHAPGMIPLNIKQLKPDYYTGNCHKWLCSPKGAAFLYVKPEKQHLITPNIISNYFEKGSTTKEKMFNSFYWLGTMDYTGCICVKAVIDYIESEIEGGWNEVMRRNRSLAIKGRDIITETLNLSGYTKESMTGSMVSIKTDSLSEIDPDTTLDRLYYEMLFNHRIETVFAPLLPSRERLLRISAHLYNKESDYLRLANALKGHF